MKIRSILLAIVVLGFLLIGPGCSSSGSGYSSGSVYYNTGYGSPWYHGGYYGRPYPPPGYRPPVSQPPRPMNPIARPPSFQPMPSTRPSMPAARPMMR